MTRHDEDRRRLPTGSALGPGVPHPAPRNVPGLGSDWLASAQRELQRLEYLPSLQERDARGTAFAAPRPHFVNRARSLRAYFAPQEVSVRPREGTGWVLRLELLGLRRGGEQPRAGRGAPRIDGDRVVYTHPWGDEWYANDARGIEQGFDLRQRPGGTGPVRLIAAVEGLSASSASSERVALANGEKDVLEIRNLEVRDARGRRLESWMEWNAGRLALAFDDREAEYPVAVDPLITTPAWIGEGNQTSASYGMGVASAGDVNGDGYSDVIVGAYKYDNGQTNEGRAFVHLGSSGGLSPTPAWTAESDLAEASFGMSVASAGDVNGDGFSDVIVGASTTGNNVGSAFVYLGSSTGLAASPAWTAQGEQNGSEFGKTVASAGDVNGDGLSDVLVGAHHYGSGGLSSQGRAYLYLSSASGLAATPSWTASGGQQSAYFSVGLAGAGDVNGDGYADVIVGADSYDGGALNTNTGRAWLYLGSATGLAATAAWSVEGTAYKGLGKSVASAGDVNADGYADVIVGAWFGSAAQLYLGSAAGLAATPAWIGVGPQSGAAFGYSVAGVGDVDGDGYADVLVGDPLHDGDQTNEGRAYLYLGSPTGLSALPVWTGEGQGALADYGWAVAGAGDVNGDGFSDVLVGAVGGEKDQSGEGLAFLHYGAPGGPAASPAWTAEGGQVSALLGSSVASAGDVNGDGYADVIVGAESFDNGQLDEGGAFVFLGSAAGLATTPAWTAEGDQAGAMFGWDVAGAGDVDGDGYADVLVGALHYGNGQAGEGRAFVYLGSATGLSATAAWTAESDQASASFGSSVASAGDVNADGFSDVVIGAEGYDNPESNEGRAYVYLGSATGLAPTPVWTIESDQAGASLGTSVAGAGDVNGDGRSDVLVSAWWFDGPELNEGKALVYLGTASGVAASPVWTVESNQAGSSFGLSVASAGDVNGDGFSDVIVGAPLYDDGESNEGLAFVYLGSPAGPSATPDWTVGSNQADASFGRAVASAGDVNGDGYSDVLVGASRFDSGETDEGRVFLFLGSAAGLSASPAWTAESDQAGAAFGESVATAGDVNGDGFSDVIVGARRYGNGETEEGGAFVYYGNQGPGGLSLSPRQARGDGTAPVQLLGSTGSNSQARLRLLGRSTLGRAKVKLLWEVKPLWLPFDGTGLGRSPSWADSGTAGTQLEALVGGLSAGTAYHARARVLSYPADYGLWFSVGPNGWGETDFRTSGVAVADSTPPDTTLGSTPATPTSQTSVDFSFTSTEAGSTFRCRKDAGAWALCSSPFTWSGLALGAHTFSVFATDSAGNHDPTPAQYAFVVEGVAPDTSLVSPPGTPTNQTTLSFAFTSTDPAAWFVCKQETTGTEGPCASPFTWTGLGEGSHDFYVSAVNATASDPTPAHYAFVVDLTPPDTSLVSPPSTPTSQTSLSFDFTSTEAGATFRCKQEVAGAYAPCTPPYSWSGLADGSHDFFVYAVDPAGNADPTPVQYTVVVESTPPETTIDSAPGSPTNQTTVSIGFSASAAGSTFMCKQEDAGTFAACTSPFAWSGLSEGGHTFHVYATSPLGAADPTPAQASFTVDTTPPDTGLVAPPATPTSQTSLLFDFDSTEAGATFLCRKEVGGAYAPCTAPFTWSGLASGSHDFFVYAVDAAGNADATPAQYSFVVDALPPDTSLVAPPATPTGQTSLSFAFTSTEVGSSFRCKQEVPGTYAPCTSPFAWSGLADGSHDFFVYAIDPLGNADPTPVQYTFVVDTTPPDTAFVTPPASPTNQTTLSFQFTSTAAGSSFLCKQEASGAFAPCASPFTWSGLGEGSHTFYVQAVNPLGISDPTPAQYAFTVDTAPPDTSFVSAPATPTNQTSLAFDFTSSEVGSTFMCRQEAGGSYAPCTSPFTWNGLADGSHDFWVYSVDAAGNADATPAQHTFVVDTAPPDTSLVAPPTTPTGQTSLSFSFTATEAGSTFQCRQEASGTYAPCTSPFAWSGLADGSHDFFVYAVDPLGNADSTPAQYTFVVDTTPPDTSLVAPPASPTNQTTVSIGFSSSAPGSSFMCKQEASGAFAPCISPFTWSGLAGGSHAFYVHAINPLGISDPTPAQYVFTVDLTPPDTSLVSPPTTPTNQTSLSFDFTSSEVGSTFMCRQEAGGLYVPCTWPFTWNGLADGSHDFFVYAVDAAGNADATPVQYTFVVDTTPPDTSLVSPPASPTNQTSVSFGFASTAAGSTFFCRKEATGTYTACTSPFTWSGLSEGNHTFFVYAVNPLGTADPTPAQHGFDVDTTPPDTTLVSPPATPTSQTSLSFGFTATEAGSTFRCRQDPAGVFAPCTPPFAWSGLSAGSHTFFVQAVDSAGNADPTPAEHVFLVDTTPPTSGAVRDGPDSDLQYQPDTTTLSASWSGFADAESSIARYEWAIGTSPGGSDVRPFTSVGTQTSVSAPGLALANATSYFVTVRAYNGAGLAAEARSDGVTVVIPFHQLRLAGPVTPTQQGAVHDLRIEVLDGLGATATSFQGVVRLSSTDPAAQLPAEVTFNPPDAGVRTLTQALVFWTAGTQSLQAVAASAPGLNGTLGDIVVGAATAPGILREANLRAAVGVPYRYSAFGRVRAVGTPPLTFGRCGGPSGFSVDPRDGTVRWTPLQAGTETLCVSVTHGLDQAQYSFDVVVLAIPPPGPVARLTVAPTSGPAPLTTVADASASSGDPTALPLSYEWDFGDGSPLEQGERISHAYLLPGAFRPTVTVFDAYGSSAPATATLSVFGKDGATPPAVRIVASPLSGRDSLAVDFRAEVTPTSARVLGYSWDLGNGQIVLTPTARATYAAGRYHVMLEAVFADGLVSRDRVEVVVTQGDRQPPECRAAVSPTAGRAPLTATWQATANTQSGPPASLAWSFSDGTAADAPDVTRTYVTPGRVVARLQVMDEVGLACHDLVDVEVLSATGVRVPSIHAVPSQAARCGLPYRQDEVAVRLVARGDGPLRWRLVQGPPGAALDEASGELAWVPHPQQAGTQWLTVAVENDGGRDERTFSLEVECPRDLAFEVRCGCGSTQLGSLLPLGLGALLAFAVRRRRP